MSSDIPKALPKKLLSHIAGYSLLQFIGPLMTLGLTPVYMRILSVEEFAALSLLWLLGLLLANLANAKLDQALRAFFFDFAPHHKREKANYFTQVFSTSFAITLILLMFFGLFGESIFNAVFSETYAFAAPLAPMIICIAILNQFANTVFVWQQNQEQIKKYSLYRLIPLSLCFALQLLGLLHWNMGISAIVVAHLLSSVLLVTALLFVYRMHITTKIDWVKLGPSFSFAAPMVVFSLLFYIDRNLDRVLVEKLLTAQYMAAFAVWVSLLGMVHLLLNALDTSLRPTLFPEFKKLATSPTNVDRRYYCLYFAIGFLAVISLWPLMFGIVILSGKEEYHLILDVAHYAILSAIPLVVIRFFGLFYVFKKKTFALTLLFTIKLGIGGILMWILTRYFSLPGTFAALVVSQILILTVMIWQFPTFSKCFLGSPYPLGLLFVFAICAIPSILIDSFALTLPGPAIALLFVLFNFKHFVPGVDNATTENAMRKGEF